jgi:hypothetical protein
MATTTARKKKNNKMCVFYTTHRTQDKIKLKVNMMLIAVWYKINKLSRSFIVLAN